MTVFVSRSGWGARSARSVSTNITPANGGVTVHYVGSGSVAKQNHDQCAAQVRSIQDYHMDQKGWSDIAYTYLACVHDHVFVGRGPGVRTAANGTTSGNQNWYAVCGLVGDADAIPENLVKAYHSAIARLRGAGGAANRINGHRDHLSTSCPGERLYALVKDGSLDPRRAAVPPWPGIYLKYPPITRHSSVTTWQEQMRTRGYSLTVDGAYGEESKAICVRFQRSKGLAADGIVGQDTWDASWR
ncbi:Putative peptidoglycan binding domain-containing protein [Amycolatopsis arida]|uniref:Putative peptidoglycan binding domain-containing protein n=1 Tax=Amycolatopsis arida TaxID=587909 RepID=A0A1I5SRW6_9PSEU|nr:peptidoglycan-binding domain-containing protein [Amycolatopsis arida]TDX96373.1 putative peptidoglycan binding protein [Amycolatopsis arida]SFP73475.1 Putative peptidoglycan binding domain-containing protein [Amycolatopsis arida]